ncbi:photosystem I reaction center subunit IV A [Panicum miliaceum]|uniref:Photosystem I reaction center subunit IV A n=1 Tax=Panicum miliaceum TaxID=4540 RepID=A0A3L6R1X6_PANMI|nr:photosystem I reaction center subunit IV A [Panicum miliaceum]
MLAAGVPATGGSSSGRVSFVSVPGRLQGRSLVVRAEEEAAAAEAPTAEGEGVVATKPKTDKPPPIGPKWVPRFFSALDPRLSNILPAMIFVMAVIFRSGLAGKLHGGGILPNTESCQII